MMSSTLLHVHAGNRVPALLRPALLAFTLLLGLAAVTQAADVPRPLANVTLDPAPGRGGPIPLTQFKGKTLIIAIISTECGACAETVGILKRIQRDYGAKGVQVVAAAVNQGSLNAVGPFIDRYGPNFPVGLLGQDDTRYLADFNESDRPFVPILIFADKGGTVQDQFFANSPFFQQPEQSIRQLLDTMLQ